MFVTATSDWSVRSTDDQTHGVYLVYDHGFFLGAAGGDGLADLLRDLSVDYDKGASNVKSSTLTVWCVGVHGLLPLRAVLVSEDDGYFKVYNDRGKRPRRIMEFG